MTNHIPTRSSGTKPFRFVRDIFIVIRPLNALITAISVWIGYFFGSGIYTGRLAVIACISAACVCAAGNIFNDFFDVSVDRINKPERPYAAGNLRKSEMILSGITLFLIGVILSFFINRWAAGMVLLTIAGLMYYNVRAKRTVLIGNVIVSLLCACAFLYGGIAGGALKGALVPAMFAAVYHFGRELLKDIEDREGDRLMHVITFPVKYGIKPALITATCTFGVLIVLTIMPFVFFEYSTLYFFIVLFGVDLLIIILLTRYWISQKFKHLQQTTTLLKAGMFFGMLALILR